MTKLLLWKQKVKEFYGEHDFWITPLFKFLLAFVVFSQINGLLGFMRQIDNIFVVLILSLICAMFSINVMTILACLLILGHCYAVGIETAGFAAVLLILLMILFLRFTSEDNVALILTPISFTLHIPAAVPVAASESTADKEETVYVKTDANGEEKTVIVSDWLKNFSGEAKIKDATDLTDVENVKGNETYKRGKKDSITWNANGKDIYYQGTSDKNLPVSMKVTYYLDGKEISPKKLVGKSGKVKIRYEYENHSAVTKTINGKQTTVYTPFTMITAAILNTDNFSNVKATNGKVISDGNKHIVIGVAMPGLADSLNLKNTSIGSNFDIPEDFEITADVEDFQMTVTATVANSDTLSEFGLDDAGDLSELTDSLKDLENATDKLCDGSGDLVKGIEKLVTASGKLKSGTKQIAVSSKQLATGLDKLVNGSTTLKNGTSQLAKGTSALPSSTEKLDNGVRQILKELQNSTPSESDQAKLQSNLQSAQTGITKELMNIKTQTESVGVSAKTLGALAESIGVSAADVGNQAGAIGEFIKNNYSSLTDEQKAQLTTIAGSLKTDAENLGGYAQSVGGQAKNLGTYAGSIGTSLQETQTDLQIVSGCLTQIQNLLTKTKTSTAQLEAALKQIAEGTGQLKTSSKTLASSIKKLDEGAKTLNSGTKTAANGAKKLSKGAKTLDNGMGQMTTGIATLKNGAVTLNKGMLTFRKDGIEKLVNTINDDAKDILDRVDAVMDEGENYQTFTKKASGTKGSVKFIIETEELEK